MHQSNTIYSTVLYGTHHWSFLIWYLRLDLCTTWPSVVLLGASFHFLGNRFDLFDRLIASIDLWWLQLLLVHSRKCLCLLQRRVNHLLQIYPRFNAFYFRISRNFRWNFFLDFFTLWWLLLLLLLLIFLTVVNGNGQTFTRLFRRLFPDFSTLALLKQLKGIEVSAGVT